MTEEFPDSLRDRIDEAALAYVEAIGYGAKSVEFGYHPEDPNDEDGPWATWYAKIEVNPEQLYLGECSTREVAEAQPELSAIDRHRTACVNALKRAFLTKVQSSGDPEIQVHGWKFDNRAHALRVTREFLADVGEPQRAIVIHNGQGPVRHTNSTCWCHPEVLRS